MKFKENKLSWTDDRIGLLKRMWKEGKSAADIAKALGKGVTRNAVIGKAHRMGLSGRPSPIAGGKTPEVKAVKKAAAAPAKKEAPKEVKGFNKKPAAPASPLQSKNNPLARHVEEPRKMVKEEIPPGGGVALIDLTERMCKWPIGDPREDDFTFCGRGIRVGTPYCPDHAAAAYQSSSRRSPVHAHAAAAPVAPVANEDKEEKEVEVEADDEEIETVG